MCRFCLLFASLVMLLPYASAFMNGWYVHSGSSSVTMPSLHQVRCSYLKEQKTGVARQRNPPLRMSFITHYEEITVATGRTVSLVDITNRIREIVSKSECKEGVVTVLSKHSTVSVTINEMEGRLVDDTRQFLLKLAPPHAPYLHNDLDFRCRGGHQTPPLVSRRECSHRARGGAARCVPR